MLEPIALSSSVGAEPRPHLSRMASALFCVLLVFRLCVFGCVVLFDFDFDFDLI
jgi:hypothetical protein